jgi:hypothetical protein
VVGNNEVLGRRSGEEFDAELDGVTEARLVAGGHLERVGEFEFKVEREERDDAAHDEA